MSTHRERLDHERKNKIGTIFHSIGILAILAVLGLLYSLFIKYTPEKAEPSTVERIKNFKKYECARLYSEQYLRFEHKKSDKYREGWLKTEQGDMITLESRIHNKGFLTISQATVTIFFVTRNFQIVKEYTQDLIGGSSKLRHLLPQYSEPVEIHIPNHSCSPDCQQIPVVTQISFLGQI